MEAVLVGFQSGLRTRCWPPGACGQRNAAGSGTLTRTAMLPTITASIVLPADNQ